MKLPTKLRSLSKRTKIVAIAAIVVVSGSAAGAITSIQPTEAEEKPQIQVQVDDHEDRITKTESDIADTNNRVDQVEQKTDENTSAIGATKERVTVVERKVVEQANTPAPQPAQTPQAVQAPAPAPTINPRKVASVSVNQMNEGLWSCDYTLESGRVINSLQGYSCHVAGTEISADIAELHGVR